MTTARKTYHYYVEYVNGDVHLRKGLKRLHAEQMYKETYAHTPPDVKEFGWGVDEPQLLSQQIRERKATRTATR